MRAKAGWGQGGQDGEKAGGSPWPGFVELSSLQCWIPTAHSFLALVCERCPRHRTATLAPVWVVTPDPGRVQLRRQRCLRPGVEAEPPSSGSKVHRLVLPGDQYSVSSSLFPSGEEPLAIST